MELNREKFLPFDLALKMELLGFNWQTFGYYLKSTSSKVDSILIVETSWNAKTIHELQSKFNINVGSVVNAPTWDEAFEWFRVNYPQLYFEVYPNTKSFYPPFDKPQDEWYWKILSGTITTNDEIHTSRQEARESLLNKLISLYI